MAQQTAMQELIDELRKTRDDGEHEYRTAYNLAIAIANEFLEKEKEQIIDATCLGKYNNIDDRQKGEEYYNQTYNQNQ